MASTHMPNDFKPLPGKERQAKNANGVFKVSIFIIVVGLIVTVKLAPDSQFIKTRVVPAILFGAIGVGGLVNVGLNLWLYRKGGLLQKEITLHDNPVRYWLLFFVFTALSVVSLTIAILFATGMLGKV
ncbi:MAG TPA: hypothetical protein VK815_02645 [Candidatus Acidoferrales bacterium]|jgi:hypothetical protein|nr:hypothetical protein [Candidatus Acidoferrales bacterium]